jgi:hypothetical protein
LAKANKRNAIMVMDKNAGELLKKAAMKIKQRRKKYLFTVW